MEFIKRLKIIKQYLPVSKFYFYYLLKKDWPLYGLIFQVTNKCNSRCLMCFNWQVINTETDELSLAEIEKFAKTVGAIRSVTLGGGEPFLRSDLPEICEIFYRCSATRKIAIPTNCLLPDRIIEQTQKILAAVPIKLKVVLSLDGIGEVHDTIRGIAGNFERFSETYEKLMELAKVNEALQVSVNSTISNVNKDNIADIIDFIDRHPGIKYHTAEVIRGSFDPQKIAPLDLKQYEDLLNRVLFKSKTLANDFANKLFYVYYHKIALRIMKQKRQILPCRSASFFPVVDAWGNVYNCEMLPKIGNLRNADYDFKKIWQSAAAKRQRLDIRNKKCWCTHYCYQLPNIIMSPWHLLRAVLGI
ncbi:MAG: radical SAM protein [Candidatus Buchananbacteria bacterium]